MNGLDKPICVYGRIKGYSLVGTHKVYPLINPSQFSAYRYGYWQLIENQRGYVIVNVVYDE